MTLRDLIWFLFGGFSTFVVVGFIRGVILVRRMGKGPLTQAEVSDMQRTIERERARRASEYGSE